jgi:hypothetical protein
MLNGWQLGVENCLCLGAQGFQRGSSSNLDEPQTLNSESPKPTLSTLSFTRGIGVKHPDAKILNSQLFYSQEEFDIILSSAVHNITLGHKHIIPPWVTSSENVVEISEEVGH